MRKSFIMGLLMFLLSVPVMAQMKYSQQYQQYFDTYKDIAIE